MTMVNSQSNAVDPYAFTLGDRMKKALRVARLTRYEMADYLDVASETVSTWMNDRVRPSTQTVRLWALKTGAQYDWLLGLECTPPDLNREPTDSGLPRVLKFERIAKSPRAAAA